jgi:hypothetical protein
LKKLNWLKHDPNAKMVKTPLLSSSMTVAIGQDFEVLDHKQMEEKMM